MSGSRQPLGRGEWRRLLDLVGRLMARPTVAAQRDLILEAATELVGGEADLWFSQALRQLPGQEHLASPAGPPSTLMERAFEGGGAVTIDSAVAIVLSAPEEILGVLQVERPDGPPFSDDELTLIEGLAAQAAAALHASRQVAVERWRIEQLSLVRTVSADVASVLDLDQLARRVTDQILQTFGYYHVALFTLEPDRETLLCRASAGPLCAACDLQETPPVRIGEGIVGHVAQTGREILADDVTRDPYYRHVDALPETRSEAALPLKIEGRVLGVLDVQSDRPARFDETDMLVLRALADQIAIALEDARLYSDLLRRADQLSAVAEVSRAVASILDLDDLLNEVVTLIHEQFGYPFVHLFTVDSARQAIVYRAGWPPDLEGPEAGGLICSLDEPEGIVSWVACHGETVLANDARSDPRYRPSPVPPFDTRSQLAAPLVFGGEVLGVLDVQSDHRDAFSDDDRFLFEALADSVAIAIRNAGLYRSERWRRRVAESMQDVAGLLSAGVALEEILEAILTELERLLPCDAAAIWLLQDGDLCLSAVRGYEARVCIGDVSLEDDSWMHQALNAETPTVRTTMSPPEPLGATLAFPPDYSAIAAPLRAADQRLGLLTLAHHTPGRYGSESRAMTAAFASYAAVAIENARLYQRAQEQAYISTVLLQVAEAIQSLTALDDVLETVVRLMPMLVGVERCALFLWEEADEAFVPVAACGLDAEHGRIFDRWRIAPGEAPVFDHLRLVKEPVFPQDPAIPQTPCAATMVLDFESPILLPLLAHGEVLGAMLVDYRSEQIEGDTSQGLDEERLAIVRGIAYQAAAAAENARLLEARQEEAYVSAALLQVAQAVVSLNDLAEILEAIVRITPMLVGVERCAIFLWDDERDAFALAQAYGLSDEAKAVLLTHRYEPGGLPLLDAVRERDQLLVLDSSDAREGLVPPDVAVAFAPCLGDGGALLAVPLSVKGDVLGAMVVDESDGRRGFDERRLEIITGIAQQAAMAVQNDLLQREMAERERLERELQLACEIQQTFMPERLPDLPEWELAVIWRAARQVAGDFYDVFELPDERLGLVVADVADKGMPAALFMALTRTLVRAAALEESSPAEALTRVNDLLVPDAKHGMFVTGIYAVLSLGTGELIYANAGHHPPLVLRSGEQALERPGKGDMALGVLEGVGFREHTISLEPGDYAVLYTDGITEALSPEGTLYGEVRLQETILTQPPGNSAQAVLDGIVDSVATFVGDSPPSDDLTLMVLRRSIGATAP